MAVFGDIFRQIPEHETRLRIFTSGLDLGRGECSLRPITANDHAEIYEIVPDHQIHPTLIVKCPPFNWLRVNSPAVAEEVDAFDEGCFALLGEMDALSKIGKSAFINMAQFAKAPWGVPSLIFRKMDLDLRWLILADTSVANTFVRLATLHMVARGLARAQDKGITIHQDLKPENILIDFAAGSYSLNGDFPALIIPKINDFELTDRLFGSRLRGFRPYLPAEHFQLGDPSNFASDRYDIYSLAIIAHELLTGGFHPIATDDPRGLHCSNYMNGLVGPYSREDKWKRWARKPVSEKQLPSITDPELAATLAQALAPDFIDRPSAAEMANAFWKAMVREDPAGAEQVEISIDYLDYSDEVGSGAQARFPEAARWILANAPDRPSASQG